MATTIATGNPWYSDTTGSWTGTKYVRLFQWVELNEDIADGDQCQFVVNGITLDMEIQVGTITNPTGVLWQIGPFNPGIAWSDFSIAVLDAGAVHIWLD